MLSIPHMIVVFVIVLVVFGPQKLPELARGLGKLMAEFRKASTDFKSAFEEEMRDLERQAREVERRKAEAASAAASAAAQTQPATLGTPSGVETAAGSGELATTGATEGSVPESGAAEGPVVAPVAEGNVARETEIEASKVSQTDGNGSAPPKTPELQAKAQEADS
jgi:TatA/E family protein of Tat protein translocase